MLDLSTIALIEKNNLTSDGAWLMLLQITIKTGEVLYLCRNTENVTWNGQLYMAAPLELDPPKNSADGELPRFAIRVSNVTRTVEGYLEQAGGGVGAMVRVLVVMSNHLDQTTPVLDEEWSVQSTQYDQNWVTFNLFGGANLFRRTPERRFLKNFCPFQYKGPECQATSTLTTCDKSLKACQDRNNAVRFGAEPGIPMGGLFNVH